eukprot:3466235-Prymnesium_polylepis.1
MAQVGAAQPVPATAGAKRVKFDDDLVLDEGDYDDGKVGTPAAAAVAAEKSEKRKGGAAKLGD